MKRSRQVHLSLATAVSLAIAGCDSPEATRDIQKSFTFQSVQQCVNAQMPVDICSDAYMAALAEHRRNAPVYDTQADCEADFVEGYCQVDSNGRFQPKLGGFQLSASGTVSESQWNQATAQAASGGGGSGFDGSDLLMGILLGNLLSDRGGRYYSEPVYRYRDSRGTFQTSTLGRRIESGTFFPKSRQARYGGGYDSPSSTVSSGGTKPLSVPSATSRGGFGSQAAARSGWGGGSRSVGG